MHVTLGPPTAEDTLAISVAMMDPQVSGWLHRFPYPYDGAAKGQDGAINSVTNNWAVRVDGQFAGMVLATPELGCWVHPRFQGSGIATRAAILALSRLFAAGAQQAHARYLPENYAMKAILDRLGFRPDTISDVSSSLTRPDMGLLRLTRADFAKAQPFQVQTERLRISPIRRADWNFVYDIAARRGVAPDLPNFRPGMSVEEFHGSLPPFTGVPPFWCKIRLQGRIIGAVGLDLRTLTGAAPGSGKALLLGGFLDSTVRGLGIASEALGAFLQELCDRYAVDAVHAEIFADAEPVGNLLKKAGFVLEDEWLMLATSVRSGPGHRYARRF